MTSLINVPVEWEFTDDYRWDWPLQHNEELVKVIDNATHFEVDLDAKNFTPKEIMVQANGDFIEIRMDHTTHFDDSYNVTRSINRSYKLPKDVDRNTLKGKLVKGILQIRALKVL
ncbi:Hsp20/alpha crystallin family protein [Dictyocaulus viviparus]|uniref:Hsp20/alpha crystallin family protein n=1 Tax=Dictyocaulus viviparus TaxID=29172 RepID=A0A0D8XVH5_DICVI|nr:Hsp20/alpha crystallin family protein [Dictyocaulus viviparus]